MRTDAASLVLKNCRMVNVHSGEIYLTDIATRDGRIVSTTAGAYEHAKETIDCAGRYALPGLIDPHMHVDTTALWPGQLARLLVPLGTTTVVVDTSNVVTTGGPAAVRGLIDGFRGLPLRAYFAVASYAPLDPAQETAGYEMRPEDFTEMLSWPECVSMGETVSSKVVSGDEDFLGRIARCLALGRRVSGHGGGLPADAESVFDAYVSAGVRDDHDVRSANHLLPRVRRGMSVFAVESEGRPHLSGGQLDLIVRQRIPTRNLHFCMDNISAVSVAGGFGYLTGSVRLAIEAGLPPVEVVRMGSLNTAEHYGRAHEVGSLALGRRADILVMSELDAFPPDIVVAGGRIVAEAGRLVGEFAMPRSPRRYRESIDLHPSINARRLAVSAPAGAASVEARVIQVTERNAALNHADVATLQVVDGLVRPDVAADVLTFCVLERYGRNGNVAVAFARGFGLTRGAIATSVSVPSNNIVAVGTNADDIWAAVRQVARIQGGHVVVADGEVLAQTPLPVGGIMSEEPYEDVVAAIHHVDQVARDELGATLATPFWVLTETVLPSLPDYGMTDRGLIDVASGHLVPALLG